MIKSFFSLFVFFFLKYFTNCNSICQTNCLKSDMKCVNIDSFKTCPSYCKPNFLSSDNKACYKCENVNDNQIYYINENDNCEINNCPANYKLVYNSEPLQCVKYCGENLFEMGGFCYKDCIGGNRANNGTSSNQCKCRYLYYTITENDKTKYICLNDGEYCDRHNFYDFDTKECLNSCPTGKKQKIITINASRKITRCSNTCKKDEYLDFDNITCVEKCANFSRIENGIKKCAADCDVFDDKREKCLSFHQCNYTNETKGCQQSCSGYITDNKYCNQTCDLRTHRIYIDINRNNTKICLINCTSKFVKEENNSLCELDTDKCFYENTTDPNKICYRSCPKGKYCYDGEFLIREKCGGIFKYHTENGNICYNSCALISDIGEKYYEDNVNYICRCFFYDNDTDKCYNSEYDCALQGLNYTEDNFCKNTSCSESKPYKAKFTINGHDFYRCYNLTQCKENKYYYYYLDESKTNGECWVACLDGKYPNENDTDYKPRVDGNGNTCTPACNSTFKKLSNGICKSKCPQNEYFIDDNDTYCIDSCNSTYIYIDENNKCSKECELYKIDIGNGKYRCVSNCRKYSKYTLESNRTCYDNCYINNTQYKYDGFNCVENCPNERPYSYNNTCMKNPIQGKFYYSDSVIVDKCDPLIISMTDPHLCVEKCEDGEVIYDNRCTIECPLEAPYFINEGNNKICVPKCEGHFIMFKNQCVNSPCDNNLYFINNHKCYRKCTSSTDPLNPKTGECEECPSPFNYYEKIEINPNEEIYICKLSCDGEKKYINVKECVESCIYNGNTHIGLDNKCQTNYAGLRKYKNGTIGNIDNYIYRCSKSCPNEKYIYVYDGDTNNECHDKCPVGKRLIVKFNENNYKCVDKCPDEYPYHYDDEYNNEDIYIPCTNYYKCLKYFKGGKCDEGCDSEYIQNTFCVSTCNGTQGYKFIKKLLSNDFYECKKYCENDEFIEKTDKSFPKCVKMCESYKRIGNNRTCMQDCSEDDGNYIYPFSGEGDNIIYKCTKSCSNTSYPLTTESSLECLDSCKERDKYLSKSENKCCSSCKNSLRNKFTQEGTLECLFECNNPTYPYYYNTETNKKCVDNCENNDRVNVDTNECVPKCASGYYLYITDGDTDVNYKKNTCVFQCPSNKPYAEDNGDGEMECKVKCSDSNRFFIREFKHYENNIQKECKPKCPEDYSYYTIYKDNGNNKAYGCQSTCDDGYIILEDGGHKLCVPNCPTKLEIYNDNDIGEKKYILKVKENEKYCYKDKDKDLYHKEEEGSYLLSNCPDDAPFHKKDDYFCKNETKIDCTYIDYETKICLEDNKDCSNFGQFKSKSKFSDDKFFCTVKCNTTYGIYETPYDTCVNDCENDFLVRDLHLINDNQNKICICENLFYVNETNKKVCFENSLNNKKCKYINGIYEVNMFGSNQCIKKEECTQANGKILSPSKDVCYETNNCTKIDENFENDIENENQCKCRYKYYKRAEDESCNYDGCTNNLELNITICLDKNGVCPRGYEKYIPETKECVSKCPDQYYLFRDLCLSGTQCDSDKGFAKDETDKLCKCNNPKWYNDDPNGKGIFYCVGTCPEDKGYLVSAPDVSQSECLKSCNKTYYPYFYNNQCYSSCANNDLLDIKNGFEIFESPKDSPNLSEFQCGCLNPWYYEDKSNNKRICSESKYPDSITDCKNFTTTKVFNYMVKSTLECIEDGCPSDYPFLFNNECFEDCETDAESYYHYLKRKNDKECECINLWFINSINKSECIEIDVNECIKFNFSLKYKINETRQCVTECPPGNVSFNYICYDECPENTTVNETNPNTCICNTTYGYWYRYSKDNGTEYLKCSLEECPKENEEYNITHVRKNLVEEKGQCVISCSEDDKFKYALRYICREDCPYFTGINAENDECVFLDINNDINITNLTLLKDAVNIQAKELYEGSEHLGGYLFNKFNASLHIYAIDLNNSLTSISFKSNLTYVDLSTCIKKIFANNENYLNENLTILVAKYDLLTDTINEYSNSKTSEKDKYLINKVEYELFSSNMSEKLEMNGTTCDPYELIISYPLTLNRFNDYEGGLNKNEYRKKFEMGKKLHLRDSNIDTFNVNNTVYKSFCRSVEIDGKDLVYEDRYKYLYPNNKILCESNCIMNNTNFDLERVICLCSFKEEIVFNREDEPVDIFNDPNFEIPTQSKFNAEAVKCLFNFTLNETIVYNEAFYYTSVIMVVKLSMIFVTSFMGIKNLYANIKHLIRKLNLKQKFGKKNNKSMQRIQFKNEKPDNAISTTGRALQNPPRKKQYNEKYNEDIDLDSDIGKGNNTILENNDEDKEDEDVNYEITIKKGINPVKNNLQGTFYSNKSKNKNNNNNKDPSENNNMKAEYIPPDYNFKFFKPKDRGLMKKMERSKVPFDINPDTNYLIERRKGVDYPEDYLDGPYFPDQNIVIITDDKNKNAVTLAKYLKDEKMMKKKKSGASKNKNQDEVKTNLNSMSDTKSHIISSNENTKTNFYIPTKSSFYKPKTIDDKSIVSIKKVNPINNSTNEESAILYELERDRETRIIDDDTSIFSLIKREHILLGVKYEKYIKKIHPFYLHIFFAEILDKIYLFRILLFLKQIDVFSLYFSLYAFCHILLLTLLCNLFTINLIKKIWETTGFPDLRFYLLYGLIANLIIWVIYILLSFLIDFESSIRDLVEAKSNMQKQSNNDNDSESNKNQFYSKFSRLMCLIRLRVSIFHIVTFLIALGCGIYLISFFALYTGTKSLVLKIYYISIIEILLIKITYGVVLAGLRIVSIEARLKALYYVVYILDKYLS